MANYFVINNKFKPYSFDELIKPYQLYAKEYDKQEALLNDAADKEFSPSYLDKELDKPAYDMYNNATNQLRAVSDELATRGLSPRLRAQIQRDAKEYKQTMNTLTQAQNQLAAEKERRAKLGPDYVYQQDDLRIGDFLNGATPNQEGVSLSGVTKDIATQFANRAKSITRDTWNKVFDRNGRVVGGYYDVTTTDGLSNAQLDSILNLGDDEWNSIMNDPTITREQKATLQGFRDAITAEKDSIGFDNYDLDKQLEIQKAINIGATAGLGTTQHKYQIDRSYDPLGWSRYYDSKDDDAMKYPQFKWNPKKHEFARDNSGNLVVNEGWKQDPKSGKWINTEAQLEGQATTTGGADYIAATPTVTVHIEKRNGKEETSSYPSHDKVPEDVTKNLRTVAIEDVPHYKSPALMRDLLNRINVPNVNVPDTDLEVLINEYLPILNQLTVQIKGTPGEKGYTWVISDKKVNRLADNTSDTFEDDKNIGIVQSQ